MLLADNLRQSRADIYLRVEDLIVDEPTLRVRQSPAFSPIPSKKDIAATRGNMLGPSVLDSMHFPFVWITAHYIERQRTGLAGQLTLRLHGVTRTLRLPTKLQETLAR